MTSAAETRSLVIEREMPHSPEKIWRALTETSLLDDWLLKNDFQPVVGHKFTFRGQPVGKWNGVIDCEVLVVEPYKKLSYRWEPWGAEAGTPLTTVVTWTLTPSKAGHTHLRMEQSGFRADQQRNLQGAKYGFGRFIDALERVLEKLE